MIELGVRVCRICHRKCMVSADSTVLSQLSFVIEKIDGKHTLCGCSRVDCEY